MVALKRFFHADKASLAHPDDRDTRGSLGSDGDSLALPNVKTPQQMTGENRLRKTEENFEVQHNPIPTRPLSSRSQAPPSRASKRSPEKNPRHVDLLDALFSSHRYHIQCASTLSPITPYNEDIAERNMVPFLRGMVFKQKVHSRPVSALYQEDVADRNIPGNKSTLSRSASARTRTTPLRFQKLSSQRYEPKAKARDEPHVSAKGTILARSTSPDSLAGSRLRADVRPGSSRDIAFQRSTLRSYTSAPDLLGEGNSAVHEADSGSGAYLGVPPAHKQGDKWSSRPLPDSPTLPLTMRGDDGANENRSPGPNIQSASTSTRQGTKKNVRDLSINTKLAARGRPAMKISHCAIQPPTPGATEGKQTPSIAEIMNSPLPVGTPTSTSPLPQSSQKVAEMMDLFRQAYASTHVISPHPTFETLQDAIVREINSHEAFQRISFPSEPSLTPSPAQESFDRTLHVPLHPVSGPDRVVSAKEGQFLKQIRKSSFKKHQRDSDQRKSISTSVPSTAILDSHTSSRRRHTDAPMPSLGLFNNGSEKKQQAIDNPEEPVTYMDLVLRSEKNSNPALKSAPQQNSSLVSSMSTKPNPSNNKYNNSETSSRAPSVLYMRAQASASRPSFSADDSDEEIIQLPSVGMPQLCIQGVDQNNVTFVTRNTSPRNAYRLMSWPRKSNANITLRNTISDEHVPSRSSSRNGPQSWETCSAQSC
ncbi:hypothetical protein BO70DRAFT_158225 [Aspergillus heteromorphus CBS 117.55]|uniref:Uncharacterized protein n=1 Tax=Aspergillus heteromorphus CBS 117.55 TaxID=1448321 RepID=A0A317WT87_9EURO|nr:uncharacterized protein BO70DRAFT_158225 [Aspergillus heteromorphus CBS 117.55]PWY89001.1 hypothetical protein BO70DRAFT_158225 [Aspergillus heteromorphus CBS 117.55]